MKIVIEIEFLNEPSAYGKKEVKEAIEDLLSAIDYLAANTKISVIKEGAKALD